MGEFNVRKELLMTQENCVVNETFRLYKYKKAEPVRLSKGFCARLPKVRGKYLIKNIEISTTMMVFLFFNITFGKIQHTKYFELPSCLVCQLSLA